MARNATVALTAAQSAQAQAILPRVAQALTVGKMVEVEYVKRDGSDATLVGYVREVVGQDSTSAVKVETANGFRSANLYNVKAVRWTK